MNSPTEPVEAPGDRCCQCSQRGW